MNNINQLEQMTGDTTEINNNWSDTKMSGTGIGNSAPEINLDKQNDTIYPYVEEYDDYKLSDDDNQNDTIYPYVEEYDDYKLPDDVYDSNKEKTEEEKALTQGEHKQNLKNWQEQLNNLEEQETQLKDWQN